MTAKRRPRTRTSRSSRAQQQLLGHIAAAAGHLKEPAPSDAAIHSARKEIKRARALLRLLRETVGAARFERENIALRDAARPLTRVRDARVLMDTLEKIGRRSPVRRTPGYQQLRMALQSELSRTASSARRPVTRSYRALRTTSSRIARWRIDGDDPRQLEISLGRIYRRARKAYSKAAETRTPGDLHEWRKQVKHLWHVLQFLESSGDETVHQACEQMHALSDDLGDDHDLSMLLEHIERLRRARTLSAIVKPIEDLIRARAARLQSKSLKRGRKLFRKKAKEWCSNELRQRNQHSA